MIKQHFKILNFYKLNILFLFLDFINDIELITFPAFTRLLRLHRPLVSVFHYYGMKSRRLLTCPTQTKSLKPRSFFFGSLGLAKPSSSFNSWHISCLVISHCGFWIILFSLKGIPIMNFV